MWLIERHVPEVVYRLLLETIKLVPNKATSNQTAMV